MIIKKIKCHNINYNMVKFLSGQWTYQNKETKEVLGQRFLYVSEPDQNGWAQVQLLNERFTLFNVKTGVLLKGNLYNRSDCTFRTLCSCCPENFQYLSHSTFASGYYKEIIEEIMKHMGNYHTQVATPDEIKAKCDEIVALISKKLDEEAYYIAIFNKKEAERIKAQREKALEKERLEKENAVRLETRKKVAEEANAKLAKLIASPNDESEG